MMKDFFIDISSNPIIGWVTSIYLYLTAGMSPLAVMIAIATLWLTWEKVITERANRKIINQKIENLEKQINTNFQDL